MIFMGDTHGNFDQIEEVCQKYPVEPVVHVGDVGLGFGEEWLPDPDTFPANFHFIRGNHDNPEKCRTYTSYLGDFGYNDSLELFYISGADSIDKEYRTEGRSWWKDEMLSTTQMMEAADLYLQIKPDVVMSHTCPLFVANMIVTVRRATYMEKRMEAMWNIHQPKYWVFGHWHPEMGFNAEIRGTRFIGLACNEVRPL